MTTNIGDVERGVSSSHEPSYYEIALTNRQVVVAFVILLICVVAAFLSGVWIGRESVVRAQEKMALLAHGGPAAGGGDTAAGGAGVADKEKPEGQALQEFKFFADSRQRRGRSEKAGTAAKSPPSAPEAQPGGPRAAAAPSTLADDLSHRAGSSSATAPPAPAAIPSAASTPTSQATTSQATTRRAASSRQDDAARSSQPAQPAQPSPLADRAAQRSADAAGEGEPLPAPRRQPDEAARAAGDLRGVPPTHPGEAAGLRDVPPAHPGGVATAGEVVIQVFSTADKEQADKVREGLAGAGLAAFLSPIVKNGQTMYRVRIGPFPSRAAAEPVAEKVRKEHKLDTWITPK
jgi:DedD protein